MLNASGISNINTMDTTTNLTVNNLSELGYTTITVWNLFTINTSKLKSLNMILDESNFNYLKELLKRKFDTILIGWGNSFTTSKKVNQAKAQIREILRPYADILTMIEDIEKKYVGKRSQYQGGVSTKEQAEEGYSIDEQERLLIEYCEIK